MSDITTIGEMHWPAWLSRSRQIIEPPRQLPNDLMLRLHDAIEENPPAAIDYAPAQTTPIRTAQHVAVDIAWTKAKIAEVDGWLVTGRKSLAELETEFNTKIDEETAVHKADCDARLAKLDALKTQVAGAAP